MRRFALLLCVLLMGPMAAQAPAMDLASLVADRVSIAGNDTLVADGNVEIFHKGTRLKASQITYDRAADLLTIAGPIVLTDNAGTLILADQAALSADFTEGVLQSARLVLDQQLQLAASEMMRIGGRYTSLNNTVVSSCKVCASNPTPLWEIRAKRVVHDGVERQIFFNSATFRVAGVPVFWIPHLRIPDPTLKRQTGLLAPSFRTTSGLGFGAKIPYFIRIGDDKDLTVTPYLSSKAAQSVELRYRQAFRTGSVETTGAISRDLLVPGQTRGYLTTTGRFALPSDFTLSFSGIYVTDDAYLVDYGIPYSDRLDSRAEVARTRRNEHISARIINYRSIRAGDVNSTLPSIVTDLTYQRRFSPGTIGGEGGFRLQTHSHARSSNIATDSDLDGISDGRDMARLSATADWRRNWVLPSGVLAAVMTEVNGDFYRVAQDTAFAGNSFRGTAGAGVELRWPWVRASQNGVSHVIEPVVQVIWTGRNRTNIPNEDSALVEFDEGNLFSMNRFPGADAVEQGRFANIGLGYTRVDPAGWSLGLTMGRVFRQQDFGQFTASSGLQDKTSDWLGAVQVSVANGVTVTNRFVFDDNFKLTKGEMRLDLAREKLGISSSYVRLQADVQEKRTSAVSELTLDGRYRFTPSWEGSISSRYDFVANRAASGGLNLGFRNECLKVDFAVSRRFTSSASVKPTTDFGLSVDLLGFGGKANRGPAAACRG
ncbi:LPS-assembly protein [Pseudorhodobacter antarcticus]|uniref:LPS-assembly protein LptD n=1 Tax=Pseudorhodobacter antarcticus TaxID=1077947 RepID=A0A1H8DH37_9RHOB|nr:LPS assembly protein LptD [Pseudorhodobacter antarcticus]SEN06599.1 LPS-assembly protein [Pseudorhodobacter antarcticus]